VSNHDDCQDQISDYGADGFDHDHEHEVEDVRTSSVPSWAIWIGALIGVNILSAIFDWPFWVY
jgi:hypothetical protein